MSNIYGTTPLSSDMSSETVVIGQEDTGIAWPAIIGGSVAASAFLILLAPLGAGLGYAWASPWQDMDSGEKTFTVLSAIWLIVVQWISSGLGGYLTGRLRTAWPGAHTHEVFFRDTAHGFLTWALTTVAAVLLLATGLSHGPHKGPGGPGHDMSPQTYAVNKLFRVDPATASPVITEEDRTDSSLILNRLTGDKEMAESDKSYLTQLVAARTNMPAADARTRVETVASELKDAEHTAHKNLSLAAIFIFFSMWIGAFIASVAGALGGAHRDTHYATGKLS